MNKKLSSKHKKKGSNPIWWLYEQETEPIVHLVSGCSIPTTIEYKENHDKREH